MPFHLSHLASPLGPLRLVTDADHVIHALDFAGHGARVDRGTRLQDPMRGLVDAPAPTIVARALARYFAGEWQALDELAVAAHGSDFQRRVWQALRGIAPGATVSYGQLARDLGFDDPRAAIDVGAANAANPVAIVVPCHRVIGSDGGLRGYAWGLSRKRWLLGHEGALTTQAALCGTATLPGFR